MFKLNHFLTLTVLLTTTACSVLPWNSKEEPCQIEVTIWGAPVVSRLDYTQIKGSREQVILPTESQHTLSFSADIPKSSSLTQLPVEPLPFDSEMTATNIESIYFSFDRFNVSQPERIKIQNLIAHAGGTEKVHHIDINAYTDSKGSDRYNQALSIKRAMAVRDYMISLGVSSNVISIAGHGESNPASTNSNSKGRALNRRAIVSTDGE